MSTENDDELYEDGEAAQRVGDGPAQRPQPTKLDNLTGLTRGPKTGKVLLVTAVALTLVVALIAVLVGGRNNAAQLPPEVQGANVGTPPSLKAQGSEALAQSQQYNEMVDQVERERAAAARESGLSSQPLADSIAKDLVPNKPVEPEVSPQPVTQPVAYQQAQPQGDGNANDPAYQQMMTNAQQAMSTMLAPRPRGMQTFTLYNPQVQGQGGQQAGTGAGVPGGQGGQAGQSGAGQGADSTQPTQFTLISAGTIESARLETGVNTDSIGSFVATLVTGKYAGARLIGSVQRSNEVAVMQVRAMSLPGQGITVPASAEVIDAHSRENGTATDVDRKLFAKYIVKPLAAGVSAVGQAVANSGTSVTVNGATTVESQPEVDSKKASQIAAGAAAEQVNSDASAINTTPTVRVAPGAIVGVVFTSDVLYTPKRN